MYNAATVKRVFVRIRDTEQKTLFTSLPFFTTIQTTSVESVTRLVDTVYTAWIPAILSIG